MFDERAIRRLIRSELVAALQEYGLAAPPPRPVSVTVARAAELTGMSEWRVRQLVRTGVLPLLDLGGTEWLIPTLALEERHRCR
jgi:hypothetical protein